MDSSSNNTLNSIELFSEFIQLCKKAPRNRKLLLSPFTDSQNAFWNNVNVGKEKALCLLFNENIIRTHGGNIIARTDMVKQLPVIISGLKMTQTRKDNKRLCFIEIDDLISDNHYSEISNLDFETKLTEYRTKHDEKLRMVIPSQPRRLEFNSQSAVASPTRRIQRESSSNLSSTQTQRQPNTNPSLAFDSQPAVVSPTRRIQRESSSSLPSTQTQRQPNTNPSIKDIFSFFGEDYDELKRKKHIPDPNRLPKDNNFKKYHRWSKLRSYFQSFIETILGTLEEGAAREFILDGMLDSLNSLSDAGGENDDENQRRRDLYDKLTDNMITISKKSPRASIQRRVLRSVLTKSLTKKELYRLEDEYVFGLGTGGATRSQSYADFNQMIDGSVLEKTAHSSRKKPLETLKDVVTFVEHQDRCQSISYGTKKIKLDNKEIYPHFPRRMRKLTRAALWREYVLHTKKYWQVINRAKKNKRLRRTKKYKKCLSKVVSKSLFYKIVSTLTSHDPQILKAVDYVSCRLLHDPIEMLEDVIDTTCENTNKKKLKKHISHVKHFLQHRYRNHCLLDDDDCHHGIDYALNTKVEDKSDKDCTCSGCKYPFYVCDLVETEVKRNNLRQQTPVIKDAVSAVNDCKESFCNYMKHVVRVKTQQQAINERLKYLRQLCIDSDGETIIAHLVLDFKMKFLPMQALESAVDHFSQRGLGWHGFLLIYYIMIEEEQDDGTMKRVPKRVNVYIDQIMKEGTKQDAKTVVSLLEAALISIHERFPKFKEISIQSDNASCYQSFFLTLGCLFLNKVFEGKIRISEIIHSETQDGKSQLDAHFAQCMSYLRSYLKDATSNRNKKIMTGEQLAFALSNHLGMTNCIVQKVKIYDEVLLQMEKAAQRLSDECSEYFARVNHIYFEKQVELHEDVSSDCDDGLTIFKNMIGSFQVQAHSGVGRRVGFCFDMKNQKFDCDEEGYQDILKWFEAHSLFDENSDNTAKQQKRFSKAHTAMFSRRKVSTREKTKYTIETSRKRRKKEITNNSGVADGDSDDEEYNFHSQILPNICEETPDYSGKRKSSGQSNDCPESSDEEVNSTSNDIDRGYQSSDDSCEIEIGVGNVSSDESSSLPYDDDESSISTAEITSCDENDSLTYRSSDDEDSDSDVSDVECDKETESGILFEQSCEYDIPTNELYSNSYTGIVVVKMKPLGIIDVTHKTHDINESPRVLDIVVGGGDVQQGKRKDALAVCVRLSAQNMLSDDGKVISAQDDDPVYKEADGYQMNPLPRGWARRNGRSCYGDSYLDKYAAEVLKCYKKGMLEKNDKMNASEIREKIIEDNDGKIFRIPSATTIKLRLGSIASEEKRKKLTLDNIDEKIAKLEEVAETTIDTIDELKQKNIVLVVNEDTLQTPEKLWERWISLMRQSNVNIDEDDEDMKSDIKYKIMYERKRMRTIARKSVVNGP